MSRPKEEEVLFAYIVVASYAVSLILIRVDDGGTKTRLLCEQIIA